MLLIFICSSGLIHAQNKIDSLKQTISKISGKEKVDALNQLSYEYYDDDPRLSLNNAFKALEYSQKIRYKEGIPESYMSVAFAYSKLGDHESAIDNFKEAIEASEELEDVEILVKSINNLGNMYYSIAMYEDAEKMYNRSYQIRKQFNDQDMMYNALANLTLARVKLKKYDQVEEDYETLLDLANEMMDTSKIVDAYLYIADLHSRSGNYSEALNSYYRLLDILENNPSLGYLADVYGNMGHLYSERDDYDNAIKFYDLAYNSIDPETEKHKAWQFILSIGVVQYERENFNEALSYYKQALEIVEELGDDEGRASILNNIGLVYKNLNEYDEALDYCKRALEIREKMDDQLKMFYPITSIAEINIKLGNLIEAARYLERGLDIAINNNRKNLESQSYNYLSEVYEIMGNYKEAYRYQSKFAHLRDTLLNLETNKKIAELNVKYESEKKEQQNFALKKANKMQLTFFLVISGLILIILMIIYARYRTKQRANQLLTEKNRQIEQQKENLEYMYGELRHKEEILTEANATKDKFFSIIAHDLKNPLHAITLSSDLLLSKYKYMDGDQLVKLISNINKAGNHLAVLLENLLQWARSQSGKIEFHPTVINLNFIANNIKGVFEQAAIKKNIELRSEIKPGILGYGDPNMIETVFRNLVSNAIKFTPENGLVLLFSEDRQNEVLIGVKDTGTGITEEDQQKLFRIDVHYTTIGTSKEKGTGLGLILSKEFIDKNGGEIFVESEPGKGSTFTFTLPKRKIEEDLVEYSNNRHKEVQRDTEIS